MAMNGNALGDALLAAVDALSTSDKANRQKVFRALGSTIVSYIQTNASINGVVGVGLSTGTGPVTGTLIVPSGSIQ